MNSFWHLLPTPFFALAPMEAVTDVVFRQVVAKAARPDVFFTEFTNATGWVHAGQKAIGGRLVHEPHETPIVAQIWGGEPGDMEQLAQHCQQLGFSGIDINMGCPAKSAIKSGGSALIRRPEIAAAAIAAAKAAGLPVSVKTRLGYSSVSEWQGWLTHLLAQDIALLTIHLRTKKEMSKVPAHHELISDIIRLRDEVAPHTLVMINGDITDRTHGLALANAHTVDGLMIGRGVFTNPFCFGTAAPTTADLLALLHYHLDLFDAYQAQTGRPFETLKRFFKIYIRDFDGASKLREQLMHCTSTAEARHVLTML
ncbi:MAG: tRNA-dihydrouridine synthase [Candidatus Saccharimonas sp.]